MSNKAYSVRRVTCLILLCLIHMHVAAIGFGGKKEPDWVKTPLADNATTYYGIGGGQNTQLAKQAALEDIAGKLLTEVESSLEVNTQVNDSKVSEQFSSNIKTSVRNVGLSGYTIDESAKKGKVYWVRVKLDKKTLASSTQSQLTPILLELKTYFATIDEKSALIVKRDVEHIAALMTEAKGKLFVLGSANPQFDTLSHQKTLSSYDARLAKKISKLFIIVQANKDMQDLVGKVVHALNNDGWSASRQGPTSRDSNKSINIKLAGSFKDSMQFGNQFSAAMLRVDIVDEFGKVLSQQEFPINGASRSSHANARQVAANKFLDTLRLEGVSEKLGLLD